MDRQARRCSFCGKPQGEVRLVAGPSEVYICHLCVALCSEILAQDEPAPAPGPLTHTELTSQKPAGRPTPAS